MTIPTRDELIERARLALLDGEQEHVHEWAADFALAALRKQAEQPTGAATAQGGSDATWAMRSTASSERAEGRAASSPCPPPAFVPLDELQSLAREYVHHDGPLQDALARFVARVIYEERNPDPGDAARRAEQVRATNVAAPALSDAEILERARGILRKLGGCSYSQGQLLDMEAKLRAASAPKPVDVFERVAMDFLSRATVIDNARLLAPILKENFGPLVEALEKARQALGSTDTAVHDAGIDEIDDALSALRKRAQEASK